MCYLCCLLSDVLSVLLLPRMREVDLGSGKALLIKDSGEFHAVGHKCPHYGAPLVKGQSAPHPRRPAKGTEVLARARQVFIQLCCWAQGSAVSHTPHPPGIFSLVESMGRSLGVHQPPGSTLPQVWFAGDPSLLLLVTGLGLLWVTLKSRLAPAPLNLASASSFSWSWTQPLWGGVEQLQLTVPTQSLVLWGFPYCSVIASSH